jgi:hypothetical protein
MYSVQRAETDFITPQFRYHIQKYQYPPETIVIMEIRRIFPASKLGESCDLTKEGRSLI